MKDRPSIVQALLHWKSILSIAFLVVCSVMCFAVSDLIQRLYPDRPIVPDYLFDILPPVPWMAYLTDPIILVAIALILAYACSVGRGRFPYYFFVVGATYLLRGPMMLLTPLGRPTGNLSSYGVFEMFDAKQHGMFPSGHVLLTSIIFLLLARDAEPRQGRAASEKGHSRAHPWYTWLAGALLALETVTLLLSHGHYSIDLIGGYLTAYLVIGWTGRFRKHFSIAARPERSTGKRADPVSP
jgi:membrane-associated phospholipid phosphatase